MDQITAESINLIKQGILSELQKAGWTQSGSATTGLTYYDLEAPSKKPIPFIIPLQDVIPSVGGGRGTQANWKAVTALNTAIVPATVVEGKRGGTVTSTVTEYLAAFKGIGLEDSITFEAEYAADGFEDLRATSQELLLKQTRIEREKLILGGLGTWTLGTTPTPAGTLVSGGAMTAQATVCYCVALTLDGYRRSAVSAAGVPTTVTLSYAGPYAGSSSVNAGHAAISAESAATTTAGGNLSVTWNVTAVAGAFAYAWYTGPTGAANCKLAAITTINQFKQTANAGGSNQAANAAGLSTDASQNSLAYDGIVSIATKSGTNGYYKSYDGATFTFDGAGGWVEGDAMLADRWANYRLGPSDLFLAGQDIQKFSKGVLTGGSSVWKIEVEEGTQQVTGGGLIATRYLNKITGQNIQVHVHPDLQPGKAVFVTSSLPYPLSGIQTVMRLLQRQPFKAWDWPIVQRQYEYGVYCDEVLQHYFPPSIAIVDNGVFA